MVKARQGDLADSGSAASTVTDGFHSDRDEHSWQGGRILCGKLNNCQAAVAVILQRLLEDGYHLVGLSRYDVAKVVVQLQSSNVLHGSFMCHAVGIAQREVINIVVVVLLTMAWSIGNVNQKSCGSLSPIELEHSSKATHDVLGGIRTAIRT
jgi:hypothetical protein